MKKIIIFAAVVAIVGVIVGVTYVKQQKIISPLGKGIFLREKKLLQYSYTALQKSLFSGGEIATGDVIKDQEEFTSYLFYFNVRGKKVSGLMNLPKKPGDYPVIIMIRGYADKDIYEPGVGTSHGGELMVENGFITLAPDFLGYGYSDKEPPDAMEDRFLTYVTVLELISSIKNLNTALENIGLAARFDKTNLGIWGHSNGGQIALTGLEISGKEYPTALWAPVSKPFPYSVLYYTDEFDDHGKYLRKVISQFEEDYDSEKYTLTNYLDLIQSPIQLHQGGADIAVPLEWSNELYEKLISLEADIEYDTYPQADHNMVPNWNTVAQSSLRFLDTHIK